VSPHHPREKLPKPQHGRVAALPKLEVAWSRPYELSDFPGLLEKYADFRPLGRSRWSSGRGRNNTVPEREEVVRERLANRYRKTYQDRTGNYALRDSEIFTLKELGKFRVISAEDLNRFAYNENRARLEPDLQHLKNQRLISVSGAQSSPEISLRASPKRNAKRQRRKPNAREKATERNAGKTRSEAGATPSRRKIAARSLRASGVTPASCCSTPQLVFCLREEFLHTELHAVSHATLYARLHDERRLVVVAR